VGATRIPVRLPDLRPYVTYTLLGITVAIYVLQLATDYLVQEGLIIYYGAKINEMIAQGQLWRLFTPMFLHGSIIHIGFNMYFLSRIGPRLERFYGHWRFLALYILSGFGGNVISMMFTDAPSLGSSTAIFGLIAAQGVFYYHNREIFGSSFRQALNGIITVAAVNLFIGLSPGIDNWGHVGGLIAGIVFAWLGGPVIEVTGIHPGLVLTDKREPAEVWQAFGIVAFFFSLLTAGALYLTK
jgi:rhomboid protease GluP